MKKYTFACFIIFVVTFSATGTLKRTRSLGLYYTESANTIGRGNFWLTVRALGFLWDSDEVVDLGDTTVFHEQAPAPYAFPEVNMSFGILDFATIILRSRILSYGWKVGYIEGGGKFSFFDNKDIRFLMIGTEVLYHHSTLAEITSSIAGYRDSKGTGFSPEGFITHGSNLILRTLLDIDLIDKSSVLPIKFMMNIGIKLPINKTYISYSQYQFRAGVIYSTHTVDVFAEYSLDAFVNNSIDPKIFKFQWLGWDKDKVWEVAFAENPMHITLGGNIRFPFGWILSGAVPLLLSQNVGTAMTEKDKVGLSQKSSELYKEESARGITDPFDPWYTKWKIVVQLSVPLRYKQTSSEMKRNFLLLKNRIDNRKIDIEKRIFDEYKDSDDDKEDARQKRLGDIRKQREERENE